ncbi:hypothetical protein KFU94_14560 [Chloroflexi bacterium TSY]|nr:hypothetical protein [Chloroflexi bacterium TSY]
MTHTNLLTRRSRKHIATSAARQDDIQLPPDWQLPHNILDRLGAIRAGQQRAIVEIDEDSPHLRHKHLLLVLHRIPQLERAQQGVFIWQSPDGKWKCYRQGEKYNPQQDGYLALTQHLNEYDRGWFILAG